ITRSFRDYSLSHTLDETDFYSAFSNYIEASSNSINLERDNILN
ncbi:3393_t:CDS:1, partial [Entrophospora sp. SA101]